MKVVPLQEEDLVVQQDRIIIIGALPEEFGTDRALRWATLRYLFLCRKLTELLALTCLGVATDGAIYLVGRRVAILLEVRQELFSPKRVYPRMLMALSRLLNRWMRCRET